MKIEVAVNTIDSEKKRGDLLEEISKKLLESHNFKVEKQIRNTGTELDLWCTNQANGSKKIYVECKAYRDTKINAEIIKNLVGTKSIKQYPEAWLISTTEIGKEAKGLIEEIENGTDSNIFTFYTPEKLIEALIASNIIINTAIAIKTATDFVKDKNKIGEEIIFLVSDYGYFWLVPYLIGGNPKGVIVIHAKTGDIVQEKELIQNIADTDSSFKDSDFSIVHSFDGKQEVSRLKVSPNQLKLNAKYIEYTNDIGMKFTHSVKDNLILEDIFIYPDLEDISDDDNSVKINSKELLALKNDYDKCIIFGDDISGKTSLAFILQRRLNEKELVPLYIDANDINNSNKEHFFNFLKKVFTTQYSEDMPWVETFTDLLSNHREKIVLVIDNFNLLGIKRISARQDFLGILKEGFGGVIIFAHDSFKIEAQANNDTKQMLQGFKAFSIKQLGYVLRDLLIEKWLTVEKGETISDGELHNKKSEIFEKVKVVVGKNFVPTYPLYLLTMLQLIETGSKNKLEGSSYAELYRYLINQALGSANAKPEDLDFYHTYLSYIAHFSFSNKQKQIPEDYFVRLYSEYAEKMDISKSFDNVHNLLLKAKLIKHENGSYSFNHSYTYYFFVAKYLSDNMENSDIEKEIEQIIKALHKNDFANIIIFLIHHSKNKQIIERIIAESSSIFNNAKPYTLSNEESEYINGLIYEELGFEIEDPNPLNTRRKKLEEADNKKEHNKENEETSQNESETLDLFARINLSMKFMQILGQITNNYYGSLDGEKKADILKEAYSLGFRALRSLLEDFEQYIEAIKGDINKLVEKKGVSSGVDRDKITNKVVFSFIEIMVFAFVKKTADSIASKNLYTTIDKVMELDNTAASKLVGLAVKLNFPNELSNSKSKVVDIDKEFPKNYLVKRLLRLLVVEHLYKFDVSYSDKQSICSRLGIRLLPNRALYSKDK